MNRFHFFKKNFVKLSKDKITFKNSKALSRKLSNLKYPKSSEDYR